MDQLTFTLFNDLKLFLHVRFGVLGHVPEMILIN
jgi:hypothetical protein